MPSRKKVKGSKGKGKRKKEIRQLTNATPAEIIRGIHDGQPAAILALMQHWVEASQRGEDDFVERLDRAGMTGAMLKILQRCDESLALVFGSEHPNYALTLMPCSCLNMMLEGATKSHNKEEACRQIASGISPVIKCMVQDRRVFFQSTEAWFRKTVLAMEQDGLLAFLGQAICWSQCRQDIIEGFQGSNEAVPHDVIISTADWICISLNVKSHYRGIPLPRACELLKFIGAVAMAKDRELPAIVGMIRCCRDMFKDNATSTVQIRNMLVDVIISLLTGGCVDEAVMKELAQLHVTCPEFVARCAARILYLSDSRFAGALRSGLLAASLSICAQLGRQDIDISITGALCLGLPSGVVCADALASGIIDQLYMLRLHHKTRKALALMSPLNFRGMEDKLEHIFRDAHESVCANCLRTIDTEALKFCKGTHMLEPFCSNGCLKESWDAGVCADQSKLENDDKR
ncbi:hypothetical protein THAOC_31353, partial [Thalassiosira oceanica]